MPSTPQHNTAQYRAARKSLTPDSECWRCGAVATTIDHRPPIAEFDTPAEWEGELLPACRRCNFGEYSRARKAAKRVRGRPNRWV